MNEQRNFILAIGLSIAVLVVWQFFIGNPQLEEKDLEARLVTEESSKLLVENSSISIPFPENVGNSINVPPANVVLDNTKDISTGQNIPRVEINSDSLIGSISLLGGKIDDLNLKNYRVDLDPGSELVKILSPLGTSNPYYVHHGWVEASGKNITLPSENTLWSLEEGSVLTSTNPIVMSWDNGNGLTFKRKIMVDEDFAFTVDQQVYNNTDSTVDLFPYALISRHGIPEDLLNFFILHEGFIGVLGEEGEKKADYDDIIDETEVYNDIMGGWLGFTDKNWATVIAPDPNMQYQGRYTSSNNGNIFQTDFLGSKISINKGETATSTSYVFSGAKRVNILDKYEDTYSLLNLDLLVDWGWFYFITKPLFYLLSWLNSIFGNYGVAILFATVIIKLFFFPLANKAYKSMSAMKKLQPEMTAIREKFKGDRPKQQQALMQMYRDEKINPMSGCLPIIIQIPVFFALYKVLFCTIEMRHEPFFGWIVDLSVKDPTSIFNLFGLIPWSPPSFLVIGVWPIIMGFTMFVQMKLNPSPPDPIQQKIFTWMPVAFTFLLAQFSAGLVVYWAWNNTLSSLQQYVIMKRMGVKVELWSNIQNLYKKSQKKKIQ
ncbi:MAG: membrane protein insertase YidC [Rhodobiaceae bacterium]|jgi:YidC/Oxa1 family membrane protein insertase|nr:membrane protein insertase YidC [Rhodobiaceae bacterium]